MGMTAEAKLAWGIDLGDPNNTGEGFDWDEAGVDSYDLEHKVMPGLFGFTEEPPELDAGWEDWPAERRREWRATQREPWEARLNAAVLLTFEHYGYEMSGTALVLKRSLTDVNWGCEAVDPVTLAAPTPEEVAAFGVVMNHVGYDGGEIRLLLMAMYG
jgi:hypothetical protein